MSISYYVYLKCSNNLSHYKICLLYVLMTVRLDGRTKECTIHIYRMAWPHLVLNLAVSLVTYCHIGLFSIVLESTQNVTSDKCNNRLHQQWVKGWIIDDFQTEDFNYRAIQNSVDYCNNDATVRHIAIREYTWCMVCIDWLLVSKLRVIKGMFLPGRQTQLEVFTHRQYTWDRCFLTLSKEPYSSKWR